MPTKKKSSATEIYQIKVTLMGRSRQSGAACWYLRI